MCICSERLDSDHETALTITTLAGKNSRDHVGGKVFRNRYPNTLTSKAFQNKHFALGRPFPCYPQEQRSFVGGSKIC